MDSKKHHGVKLPKTDQDQENFNDASCSRHLVVPVAWRGSLELQVHCPGLADNDLAEETVLRQTHGPIKI